MTNSFKGNKITIEVVFMTALAQLVPRKYAQLLNFIKYFE